MGAYARGDALVDLSFFGRRPGMTRIETVFALRFSNFGMLFTTWSYCQTEQLSDEVIEALVQATRAAGFQYVPSEPLGAPYTGEDPVFADATWWDRFFGCFRPCRGLDAPNDR